MHLLVEMFLLGLSVTFRLLESLGMVLVVKQAQAYLRSWFSLGLVPGMLTHLQGDQVN